MELGVVWSMEYGAVPSAALLLRWRLCVLRAMCDVLYCAVLCGRYRSCSRWPKPKAYEKLN